MIDTPSISWLSCRHSAPPCVFAVSSAGVAQLVEQRFRKPQVVGSIPIAGSIITTVVRNVPPRIPACYQFAITFTIELLDVALLP
jgi:hypothetical protein